MSKRKEKRRHRPDGETRVTAPTRGLALVGLSLAVVVLWTAFRVHTGTYLEDSLITFRYAENLAQGHGFVYNLGERVLGTTTPLLTMLLALIGAVVGVSHIPASATALMFLTSLATGWLIFATLKRLDYPDPIALLGMAAYLFHPDVLWMTAGGMETPLVMLLMVAGFYGIVADRPMWAGVSSALLVVTRIDGAIWSALILTLLLVRTWRSVRRNWLPLAVAASIALAWFAFAWWYFGGPIPHSVAAKRVIGVPVDSDIGTWKAFSTYAAWFLNGVGQNVSFTRTRLLTKVCMWIWFLLIVLGVLGASADRRRRDDLRLLAVFLVVYSAALYLGRAPRIAFPWYLAPLVIAALLLGIAGFGEVPATMRRLARRSGGASPAASHLLVGALVGMLLGSSMERTVELFNVFYKLQVNEDGLRKELGNWLRLNTPVEASVAVEAIGYQGYYSKRRIIDLAGLVSPDVVQARRRSVSNAEGFHRVCSTLKPDYLVLRSFEVDQNRHWHGGPLFATDEQRHAFDRHYEEARRFSAPLQRFWGEVGFLTVFRRRGD